MGMLTSKLPFIVIVANKSYIVNRQWGREFQIDGYFGPILSVIDPPPKVA